MEKIVVLTKHDAWSEKAGRLAQIVFGDRLIWIQGSVGDSFPAERLPPHCALRNLW